MKGVILAGGLGTRLYPLTQITNKHLLPVGREAMILNPIRQLISANITDILIITSKEHMGNVVQLLGSGKELNCDFTFKVQEEAQGIAQALALAEDFSHKEKIVVILGDNISTHSIKPFVQNFKEQSIGAKVLLRKVTDPERYGVAALDEKNIIEIEEKPDKPKSDFAVIGMYMFDYQVFDIIRTIQPSKRGELEITSVNNVYLKNKQLTYDILHGEWTDAGTFDSLHYANSIMMKYDNQIVLGS